MWVKRLREGNCKRHPKTIPKSFIIRFKKTIYYLKVKRFLCKISPMHFVQSGGRCEKGRETWTEGDKVRDRRACVFFFIVWTTHICFSTCLENVPSFRVCEIKTAGANREESNNNNNKKLWNIISCARMNSLCVCVSELRSNCLCSINFIHSTLHIDLVTLVTPASSIAVWDSNQVYPSSTKAIANAE